MSSIDRPGRRRLLARLLPVALVPLVATAAPALTAPASAAAGALTATITGLPTTGCTASAKVGPDVSGAPIGAGGAVSLPFPDFRAGDGVVGAFLTVSCPGYAPETANIVATALSTSGADGGLTQLGSLPDLGAIAWTAQTRVTGRITGRPADLVGCSARLGTDFGPSSPIAADGTFVVGVAGLSAPVSAGIAVACDNAAATGLIATGPLGAGRAFAPGGTQTVTLTPGVDVALGDVAWTAQRVLRASFTGLPAATCRAEVDSLNAAIDGAGAASLYIGTPTGTQSVTLRVRCAGYAVATVAGDGEGGYVAEPGAFSILSLDPDGAGDYTATTAAWTPQSAITGTVTGLPVSSRGCDVEASSNSDRAIGRTSFDRGQPFTVGVPVFSAGASVRIAVTCDGFATEYVVAAGAALSTTSTTLGLPASVDGPVALGSLAFAAQRVIGGTVVGAPASRADWCSMSTPYDDTLGRSPLNGGFVRSTGAVRLLDSGVVAGPSYEVRLFCFGGTYYLVGAPGAYVIRTAPGTATFAAGAAGLDLGSVAWNPGSTAAPSATTMTGPASTTYGAALPVTVSVAASGATPTGSVVLRAGSAAGPVLASGTLAGGMVSLTVPGGTLQPGTTTLVASYAGSGDVAASTATRAVRVVAAAASAATTVTKRPARSRAGRAVVTVVGVPGAAAPQGPVRITLAKRGSASKAVRATVVGGRAIVRLPKLARGTWTLRTTYLGEARYAPATAAKVRVVVR